VNVRRFVIATTLICMLLVAHASAAAPRQFYGVIAANDPDSTEIARMGTGRVGTLRINFVWGAVQPSEGSSYQWGHYDAIIGAAAQQGIRVLPTVYSSPAWAAHRTNYPPDKAHTAAFGAFVQAAAARYGANGSFWSENPGIPRTPVTDWQLWNEVNSPSFWYPKPNAKQYKKLLIAAHKGVRSVDPKARIVIAGMYPTPRLKHGDGIVLSKYMRQLYRSGGRRWFDVMALHPYALTPKQTLKTIWQTRRLLRRYKDGRKPIWITEVGWATSGYRTLRTVKPKLQAKYLRQTFHLTARSRKRLRIAGVVWFSLQDEKPKIWFYRTGLFTRGFKPKPSWRSFVRFTHGKP
jgi:hypothetical protein